MYRKICNLYLDGIQKNRYDSIKKCDITDQNNLFSNIILSGCSSMFKGLAERIKKK